MMVVCCFEVYGGHRELDALYTTLYRSGSVWAIFFIFKDTAKTEIYTLSLHVYLPIAVNGEEGKERTQ